MNYFKPPTTECTDQYEVIRFNLTWNLCLALCILLSLLSIANFYNDNYTSLMNIMEEGGHSKSFGLELIDTMTEQLEGECTLEKTDKGTFYTFFQKALAED